jgi:putative membrane protein insertion efficiency factor
MPPELSKSPEDPLQEPEISKPGFLAQGLMLLVRFYQRVISPLWPAIFGSNAGCRFYPSCSNYALEALREHGALRGFFLSGWRILRCTPLSKGGMDPVPPRRRSPSCVRAE